MLDACDTTVEYVHTLHTCKCLGIGIKFSKLQTAFHAFILHVYTIQANHAVAARAGHAIATALISKLVLSINVLIIAIYMTCCFCSCWPS